jgi:hypothetical protein
MSDKLTLEQAQTLIGAEVAFLVRGNEVERGIVREAGPDGDGDLCLKLTSGTPTWPNIEGHGFKVIAPATASANETPAARVARLRAELKQAQAELDAVSPAFPSSWSMRDGVACGSDGEKIEVRGSTVLAITDDEGDMVFIDLAAVRAYIARLG